MVREAIEVNLDHRDGLSLIVIYPYNLGSDKKVQLAPPFATKGKSEVFNAKPVVDGTSDIKGAAR